MSADMWKEPTQWRGRATLPRYVLIRPVGGGSGAYDWFMDPVEPGGYKAVYLFTSKQRAETFAAKEKLGCEWTVLFLGRAELTLWLEDNRDRGHNLVLIDATDRRSLFVDGKEISELLATLQSIPQPGDPLLDGDTIEIEVENFLRTPDR